MGNLPPSVVERGRDANKKRKAVDLNHEAVTAARVDANKRSDAFVRLQLDDQRLRALQFLAGANIDEIAPPPDQRDAFSKRQQQAKLQLWEYHDAILRGETTSRVKAVYYPCTV